MKKALLFFAVFISLSTVSFSQDVTQRKYETLKKAESAIFQYGFEFDTLQNVIYPEIISNRGTLAPHYPDLMALERTLEARENAIEAWIVSYPTEYESYLDYLKNYIHQLRN